MADLVSFSRGPAGAGLQHAAELHNRHHRLWDRRRTLGNDLLTDLREYWSLGERYNPRTGQFAGNILTSNATDMVTDGLDSLAIDPTGGKYVSRASDALTTIGNNTHTWCAWCKVGSINQTQIILAKDNATLSTREYSLYLTSINHFRYFMANGGATIVADANNTNVTAAAGNWYMVCGWFDAAAGIIYCDVNAANVFSANKTANPVSNNVAFVVGNDDRHTYGFTGPIQRVGIWNRVLTADERSYLYNGGRGRNYPFI